MPAKIPPILQDYQDRGHGPLPRLNREQDRVEKPTLPLTIVIVIYTALLPYLIQRLLF